MSQGASRKTILLCTASAVLLAAGLLFVAILPAEFGVDYFGLGEELGLT